MNNRKTPRIRFRGFTDDWEQRKFSDLVETRRGLTYKPADIREIGVRVLRSSNIDEDCFVRRSDDIFVDVNAINIGFAKENDILITAANGSSRLVGKHTILSDIPDKSTVHGGFMLLGTSEEAYFANALMSSTWYKKFIDLYVLGGNGAIGNLNKRDLDEQDIFIPTKKEQQVIGNYFANLDHLITLHQRKLEKLKIVKKAMLENCFPKNGEKVPKFRFSGFTGDWEQRKLGEIGKAHSGVGFPDAEQGGRTGVPFFKVSDMNLDVNENEMTISNNYVTAEQIANHRWSPITELPAIFFAKVGAAVLLNRKRLCRFPFLLDNNTMSYSLSPTKWDADFAKALFGTVDLTSLVQVGALPSYNAGDVESMEKYLPSLLEQEQIGVFFKHFDHLITLHQRKLEKLKIIKKSFLEKMFV